MNRMIILAAIAVPAVLVFGVPQSLGSQAPTPAVPRAATSPTTVAETAPAAAATVKPTPLPPTPAILPQAILGRADAPVTMIEFASLTCGHCAHFAVETLPKLKKAYIDTGKVRLVLRDFPLDRLALAAATLAHCAGPQRYFGYVDALFSTQETWVISNDPLKELEKVARQGGMSAAEFNKCMADQNLATAIRDRAEADAKTFGIDATPTFSIDGTKVVGDQPYATFVKVIDDALKAAKAAK